MSQPPAAEAAAKKRRCDCTVSAEHWHKKTPSPFGSIITLIGPQQTNAQQTVKTNTAKQIFVCDDVWLNTFSSLDPSILGLKLAFLSYRFDGLVDLHFKGRKWSLGNLEIIKRKTCVKINRRNQGYSTVRNRYYAGEELPVPQCPLPDNIIGFKSILIYIYLDYTVIAFLRLIGRLLETDIKLRLENCHRPYIGIFIQNIWPLLKADGISKIELSDNFHELRTQISPTILRDCANLRSVCALSNRLFPTGTADDTKSTSNEYAMSKWLLTPRADGRPKVFEMHDLGIVTKVDQLKKAFLNFTNCANFIIIIGAHEKLETFELKNWITRERFSLQHIVISGRQHNLLVRGPIQRDEQQWDKWSREAISDDFSQSFRPQWKELIVCLYHDEHIGPFSAPAAGSS